MEYNLADKEKQLVIRLIGDDEDAFCELYAAYRNRLFYFAMKFVKSGEFAEDIYQDVFTLVWQTRRFLDPSSSFSSYLYTIARNRILNLMRNMASEEKLQDYILSQAIDSSEDSHEKFTTNELNQIVAKAISELTMRQREVFEMSRYQGLSHKDIAESLGISIYTVQEHISSALKQIHSKLKKHYGTYSSFLLLLVCINS